jgi:hypothetical protein
MKYFKEEYSTTKPLSKGIIKPSSTLPATQTSNPPNLRSTKAENPKENLTSPVVINTVNSVAKDESFTRNHTVNTVSSSAAFQHKSLGDFARKNIDEDVV